MNTAMGIKCPKLVLMTPRNLEILSIANLKQIYKSKNVLLKERKQDQEVKKKENTRKTNLEHTG